MDLGVAIILNNNIYVKMINSLFTLPSLLIALFFQCFHRDIIHHNGNFLPVITSEHSPMHTSTLTWDCWYGIGEMDYDKYEIIHQMCLELSGPPPTYPIQLRLEDDIPF